MKMVNSKTSSDISEDSSSSQTEIENHISVSPYAEGEKVFAYHTSCLYEAKVKQIEYKHKRWSFFLHYLGWKKTWDEWVGIDRLMKHTEENMLIKLALDEKYGNDKNARKPRGSSKSSNVARGRKRKNDSLVKEKLAVLPDKLVNIQIPLTLKKQLVDDFEFITHLGKLVKLPRTPNVNDIFKTYFDYRLKKSGSIADSVEEIMKGLSCYFDKALPVMLLYNNERQQYLEACPNDIVPSAIYGAEHLLRLFGMLIGPSQSRWLYHLGLCICCFARESRHKGLIALKVSLILHVMTFDLIVALAPCYGNADVGRVLQNAGHLESASHMVKLPELLFHANIEGDTLIELQAQVLDFLRFLRKNQRAFFLSSYHVQEDVENSSDKQVCIAHNIT